MKKIVPWLFLGLLLAFKLPSCHAFEWRTDLGAAAYDARTGQKLLLLDFSGSDWCGWCKKLDAEVFSTAAFQEYAASNLVSVLVDFPRSTRQDEALKVQNQQLLDRFRVEGFPTVLVFSPDGELIGELGYQPGGPAAFIDAIRQVQARHRMRAPDAPPGPRLLPE